MPKHTLILVISRIPRNQPRFFVKGLYIRAATANEGQQSLECWGNLPLDLTAAWRKGYGYREL